MAGPAAPKDPEKSRPYFYIMKEKAIFGAPQEDGTGIQFIYESDGRLISSANIVGNIEDENVLELLKTVDGFRKLVHSIGVSITTDDPLQKVRFVFQMYGKENLYGGGTNLITNVRGDGMEQRVYLEDTEWSTDDDVPGQIKLIFDKPELMGQASIRFYLNEGYTAPADLQEEPVDVESKDYKQMIQNSLMNLGNAYRIRKAIAKAKAGKNVTLAYIGGSITQGAGATPINTECYAYKSYQNFCKAYAAEDNVKFIKAGVGGTPSELGMIRFDRDVLRHGEQPDLVVIEFAVNDEGDETKGDCYESLVKKVLSLPSKPAVILLFSVFADDYNLQDRLRPVGDLYDLPMVSVKDAVTPQFSQKKGAGRVLTKNQYFYDMFHPTNLGHTIMADCLQNLFEECDTAEHARIDTFAMGLTEEEVLTQSLQQSPAIGNSFEHVKLMDKKDELPGVVIDAGGFAKTDTVLQSVEMDLDITQTPEFPYNWMYDGTDPENAYFELRINCKALLLVYKDSGEVNVGKAEVFVDGTKRITADPHINNWLHCNAAIVFNEKESKEHVVRIQVMEEDKDKLFTILGFGYVL